ncbi:MAG: putative acetyltransferase [Sphaerisporangium sp.]|jgi:hypothetical protein|nr:putative acetyltransferase [Sphaerisporangium sp.]
MLKTFSDQDTHDPTASSSWMTATPPTFPAFAEQLGVDGFAFLTRRMRAGHADGPILVAIEDRRIVGALGCHILLQVPVLSA